MKMGATFSPCRRYRYTLHRIWQPVQPLMCWVLLNPSTADETRDDPTIRRCMTRAINTGFGGIEIVNLFAWRSTDPKVLATLPDPVGPENDLFIRQAAQRAGQVVCGWGKNGALKQRGKFVLGLLHGVCEPYALRMNADGTPEHPLYIPYEVEPRPLTSSLFSFRQAE